jgi:hypothetical protein
MRFKAHVGITVAVVLGLLFSSPAMGYLLGGQGHVALLGFAPATRKSVSLEREGPTVIGIALALPDPCPRERGRSGIQICM